MRQGFQEAVLSVFDLERIAGAMVAVGGYARTDLPDAPREQHAAWRVPTGCSRIAQCLLTAPNDDRGALRLVKFEGVEQRMMRSSQQVWEPGGHFDVDIYSADASGVYAALQQRGWTAFADPVDYAFGKLQVREVVINGPDGFAIGLIQRRAPPLEWAPGLGAMSRSFNASQIVREYAPAAAFYRDVLGWQPMVEIEVTGTDEPAAVIGLPMPQCADVVRRIGIWHPEGLNDGSIELIACEGIASRDFSAHAVAPNVGMLSLRFPVPDVSAVAARILGAGWPLYTAPMDLEIAGIGRVSLCAVRTPDGAILEFYEPSR